MKATIILYVAVAALSGCLKRDPLYCDDSGSYSCGPGATCDLLINECRQVQPACDSGMACPAATPVCSAANVCVECEGAQTEACGPTEPVCRDFACTACRSGADCASGACLPDGSCAAVDAVAYIAPGAAGDCSMSSPCGSLAAATATLTVTRNVVHAAPGMYVETATWAPTGNVTLTAETGAMFARAGANTDILVRVQAGSALTIRGGDFDSLGDAFDCAASGTLRVSGAAIHNSNTAIRAVDCVLDITASHIYSNQGGGIDASGGSTSITASHIYSNQGGGIDAGGTGASFSIRHNFIFANGGAASLLGGVNLESTDAASAFEFNTVAANRAAVAGAGAQCTLPSGAAMMGNLVVGNAQGNNGPTDPTQAEPSCAFVASYVAGDPTGVAFASADSPYDFHLTAATPNTIIDAAGACVDAGPDIDGDARPLGAACDIGADEAR